MAIVPTLMQEPNSDEHGPDPTARTSETLGDESSVVIGVLMECIEPDDEEWLHDAFTKMVESWDY